MTDRQKEIRNALAVFLGDGQVSEIRSYDGAGNSTMRVYFRDRDLMASRAAIVEQEAMSAGIYFVPNPIRAGVLPDGKTHATADRGGSTKAEDITSRRWLLIDADPIRFGPDGKRLTGKAEKVPSTESERAASWEVIHAVRSVCEGFGMSGLVIADSGNGFHCCAPIDLPNDADSYDLIGSFLAGAGARFDTMAAQIDQKVKDAGRIWKLYGSTSRKGENPPPDRTYRYSRIIEGQPWTAGDASNNNEVLKRIVKAWKLQDAAYAPPQMATAGRSDALARAIAYIEKEEPAVSGQRGHDRAFHVACVAVQGFNLSEGEALDSLQAWNARCSPPWSEKELRHKIADAQKAPCEKGMGYLLREDRQPVNRGGTTLAASAKDEAKSVEQVCTITDLVAAGAAVEWLWPSWIQMAVLTAIAAEGGKGKTRFVADLLRRIVHGLPWPDGQEIHLPLGPDSKALWVIADNNHDEMVKVCKDFGIDQNVYVNSWKEDPYGGVSLDTAEELAALDRRVSLVRPVLVVIDTVGNSTDRNLSRQEEAKAYYQPLQIIARRYRCAILCLTHLNAGGKFLGRRVLEKVRVALQMSKPDASDPRRKLWVEKTNSIAPQPLGVTMGDCGNEYDHTPPEEANDEPGAGRPATGVDPDILEWLRAHLSTGMKAVGNTRTLAEEAGINSQTLYRAKEQLKVVEETLQGRKWWTLPSSESAEF